MDRKIFLVELFFLSLLIGAVAVAFMKHVVALLNYSLQMATMSEAIIAIKPVVFLGVIVFGPSHQAWHFSTM